MSNIFYFALVAGYIEPKIMEIEDLDQNEVKESIGEWMVKRKVLNIPIVQFEPSFTLRAKHIEPDSDVNN